MALKSDADNTPKSGGSYLRYFKAPYFTTIGKITRLKDFSGTPPYDKSDFHPWDIGLQVVVTFPKKNGGTYDWKFWLGGDVTKDEKGEWISWMPTAWRLNNFLQEFGVQVGMNGIPEINKSAIPNQIIDELQGKHVMVLSYVRAENQDKGGGYLYGKFDQFKYLPSPDDASACEEAKKDLIRRFRKSVDKGYPKNYSPELLQITLSEYLKKLAKSMYERQD